MSIKLQKTIRGETKLVYCSKCGTLNPDTAINCSNCGAPLPSAENKFYSRYERRRYYREQYGYGHRGSGIGLLIAGLFIVLIGVAALSGFTAFWNYFWPIVLVLIGVWVLALGLRHNRRYRQAPPP
jgi:hypothetical protein